MVSGVGMGWLCPILLPVPYHLTRVNNHLISLFSLRSRGQHDHIFPMLGPLPTAQRSPPACR